MKSSDRLVWIDLEMTGLDPQQHTILEIATIITDTQLNEIARSSEIVIHHPEAALACMNEFVCNLHTKSGLLNYVRQSTISLAQAQQETLKFIATYCEQGKALLAGNSIWKDKSFLELHMPEIMSYLHYRIIDVSSVKELVVKWYPNSPYARFKKTDTHRALQDIEESIAELRHYRNYFFVASER